MNIQTLEREWFRQCVEHLAHCTDENCELYWGFAYFIKENGIPKETEAEWLRIISATPDHRDFGRRLSLRQPGG